MRRLRFLFVGTITAALAISTLAAPVAAAGKGDVAIINGLPGVRVDVCINGKEIRSALPYGSKVLKRLSKGSKKVAFFKKDPRKCRGTKLGKKSFKLASGGDKVIVITKKYPRVVMFDTSDLRATPPDPQHSLVAFMHAADIEPVELVLQVMPVDSHSKPIGPATLPEPWSKRQRSNPGSIIVPGPQVMFVAWTFANSSEPLMGETAKIMYQRWRYARVFIGTKYGNARTVSLDRPL